MARDIVLVLNAGSSSLKFSVYTSAGDSASTPRRLQHGEFDGLNATPHFRAYDAAGAEIFRRDWPDSHTLSHDAALSLVFDHLDATCKGDGICAVGHRVVHGGTACSGPVHIDAGIVETLQKLVPLAPLHQPHNLEPIRRLMLDRPALPQVACFDTAFHRSQPPVAQAFALPPDITERGVHRYGFHGLSYEYIARTLPQFDAAAASGSVIVAHLGNGSSLCAMRGGVSVATTMGFTALDGLPMGSRSGSIDPGVLLYLMDEMHMDARAIENLLYRRSGLLGVSGISADMRELLDSSDPRAEQAIALYVYRIGREIGSLAAALGGLDALVFTAGIGEHAAPVRERIGRAAAWLGVDIDPAANATHGPRVSAPDSRVPVWVIPTDEELMIATHTLALLAQS
jgi:acetate kinase